ncbi:MAG: glycoside hydrolase family 127 protein [Lachnospiraceae bacterium]|nr:glycoside hydrolase family 127 protein [Lachnospiraceae bacterium]
MNQNQFSTPVSLWQMDITDTFWHSKMELVRREMLPYQWKALNDQMEGAEPSFCIHNFKAAAKWNSRRREQGEAFREPEFTFRGFQTLPEDPNHLQDNFYGFVFQDSDLYKWIEAVAYSLIRYPDADQEKQADDAIDLICAAQQEDGYLDTYYILNGKNKIFSNLRDHHELYCFGHLVEAAVAYYQATGKDKLLHAARRFADYIADFFGAEEGKCKGYPGHEIAEMALVRLYEVTGEQKYLDLSAFFVNERVKRPYYFDGEEAAEKADPAREEELRYFYYQAHVPVRQQGEVTGHAVRAMYLYSGVADLARINRDQELQDACERLWDNMLNQKLYITGGIGGTHIGEAFSYPYDLPNDTAYAETCASVGLVFWARRMLQVRADVRYGDVMELALYNSVLSGVALDGKSFFYVNPLQVTPEACRLDERKSHVKPVRQKWFGCACCPPNLARLLSSIASYAYTENENTLFVHLFMQGTIRKMVQGEKAEISLTTDYPWDGTIRVSVKGTNHPLTIALRIPAWCREKYQIRGTETGDTWMENGYLYIRKIWMEEDLVELILPMEVRIMEADSRVREDIGKVAVMRGPFVYCLEEIDNGKDLHLLSLDVDAEPRIVKQEIGGRDVSGIILRGYRREAAHIEGPGLYRTWRKPSETGTDLKFIPYYTWANRGENEMQVWVDVHTAQNKQD